MNIFWSLQPVVDRTAPDMSLLQPPHPVNVLLYTANETLLM